MPSLSPLDLALAGLLALRRFGVARTVLAAILLTPVWLWSLPPVSCGCFGPVFRRCDGSLRYLAAVKSDLKNLASQQEIHFADRGVYSADRGALSFTASTGVDVRIYVDGDSWAAVGTHAALSGTRSCAVYGGAASDLVAGFVDDAAPHRPVCSD